MGVKGDTVAPGATLTLGIRPEHITITQGSDARHSGKIVLVERLGHQTFIEITDAHNQSITALIDADQSVSLGQIISLKYDAEKCHLFDERGENIRSAT